MPSPYRDRETLQRELSKDLRKLTFLDEDLAALLWRCYQAVIKDNFIPSAYNADEWYQLFYTFWKFELDKAGEDPLGHEIEAHSPAERTRKKLQRISDKVLAALKGKIDSIDLQANFEVEVETEPTQTATSSEPVTLDYALDLTTEQLEAKLLGLSKETQAFLLDCEKLKIFQRVPERFQRKLDKWRKRLDIALRYFLGDETVSQIAQSMVSKKGSPPTPPYVQGLISQTVEDLYALMTPSEQASHQLQKLTIGKRRAPDQRTLIGTQEEVLRWGRPLGLTEAMLLEGSGLKEATPTTRFAVTLSSGVFEIVLRSESKQLAYDQLLKELLRITTRNGSEQEVRSFLDQLTLNYSFAFVKHHPDLLSILSGVIQEIQPQTYINTTLGLEPVVRAATEKGIQFRSFSYAVETGPQKGSIHQYHFFLTKDKEAMIQLLKTAPALAEHRKLPVRKIFESDTSEPLPTSYELLDRTRFHRASDAYRLLKVTPRDANRGYKFKDLFDENCPIPVYQFHNSVYYSAEAEKEVALVQYLQKKHPDKFPE